MSRMEPFSGCRRGPAASPFTTFAFRCLVLLGGALTCATSPVGAAGDRVATVPEQEPLNNNCPGQPVDNVTFIEPAALDGYFDWDYYTFTTTAGTPITLGTEDPGGFPYSDTIIDLWGPCNSLIVSDGDSGPLWYSLIYRYIAPYTGTYSMRVHGGTSQPQPYRAFIFCGEPPTGACCVPTGECRLENRVTCREAGGIFYGERTACETVTCPPPIANETCAEAISIPAPGFGELSGHLGYARNDYDPWAPSCTGRSAGGKDVAFRVELEPEDVIQLSYTQSETDASIYIVTDCNDVVASCVAGADAGGYQETETLIYRAGTPPPGACCFDGQLCQIMTEQDCAEAGGVFRGIWTNCDPNYCYLMQGACCFPGVDCVDQLTPWQCEAMGGSYAGDGTMCYWQPCPLPVGACCVDGVCSLLSGQDCAYVHGIFLGEETSCQPSPCLDPIGACCYSDHTCRFVPPSVCAATDGTYQGDGVSCYDITCGGELGACCIRHGECLSMTQAMCEGIYGMWQGGYDCNPNPCPAKSSGTGESPHLGSRAQAYYVILDSSVEDYGGPWTLTYSISRPSEVPEPALPTAQQARINGGPNPFAESTRLSFSTPTSGPVRLEIFDAGGRMVRRLADYPGPLRAEDGVEWDGRDDSGARVPAGVYFARLRVGPSVSSRAIVRID